MRCLVAVVLAVVCITGGECCCQPDEYSFDYQIEMSGQVPMGQPGGPPGKISGSFTGSESAKWSHASSGVNMSSAAEGTVTIPAGQQTMTLPVKGRMGVISDNSGTRLWMKGEVPMMGVSQCVYVNLIGGVPDTYQCTLDYMKSNGKNKYMEQNPYFKQHVTVDDQCMPEKMSVSVNVPPANVKAKLELTGSNAQVTAGVTIDNQMPDDCQLVNNLELPELQRGGPAASTVIGSMMTASKQKRSLMKELAKRAMEKREMRKRAAKESLDHVARSVRAVLDHVF